MSPHPTATPPSPPPAQSSRVSFSSPSTASAAFVTSPRSAVASVSLPTGPALAPEISCNEVQGAAVGMSSSSTAEGEPSEFTEVVVVRHGETSWNASRIIQGHLDAELNEIGRQQAVAIVTSATLARVWIVHPTATAKVAHRLSKEAKPAAIYSSDLKRAAETANTIAKICNLPNVVLDPALRERHIGDLQGLTLQDAVKERTEAYKAFMSHKRNKQIPGGGESLDQLSERCVSSLYNIVEKHKGERVILVSHGGTIRELYRHASQARPLHGKIHNTSVSVILVSGDTGRCIVKMCGDISHLEATGVLENAFGGDKSSA